MVFKGGEVKNTKPRIEYVYYGDVLNFIEENKKG